MDLPSGSVYAGPARHGRMALPAQDIRFCAESKVGSTFYGVNAKWLAVARGDEPADLVISGGRVFSVFTREWVDVGVALVDGYVVGLGDYDGRQRIDAEGAYLVPGFIDAHVHIESSKLMLDQFSRAVLPHGTTAVVADPHEIANVLGTDGVHWLPAACESIPLDVFLTAP